MHGGRVGAAAFGDKDDDGIADFEGCEEHLRLHEMEAELVRVSLGLDRTVGGVERGNFCNVDGGRGGIDLGDGELELDHGKGRGSHKQDKHENEAEVFHGTLSSHFRPNITGRYTMRYSVSQPASHGLPAKAKGDQKVRFWSERGWTILAETIPLESWSVISRGWGAWDSPRTALIVSGGCLGMEIWIGNWPDCLGVELILQLTDCGGMRWA